MNPNSTFPQNHSNPNSKGGTKNIFVIIVLVILVALVAVGAIATFANPSRNSNVVNSTNLPDLIANPEEEPEVIDSTCATTTYTNADYPDFSFKYGCEWTLTEILTKSSKQGGSVEDFNEYSIELVNGDNSLTFEINGPVLDGSSTCEIRSYEKISNTLFRVKFPSEEAVRVYSYYPKLDIRGSAEFNSLKAVRTDITGDETFCYDQYNNYQTKSKVISVNGAGVDIGKAYSARVVPTLRLMGALDVEAPEPEGYFEVLTSADQIMSSFKN